jgi:DNA-binding transcriptional MerR regulator
LAKGPEAFRTISEAAEELGVPQHVLRFWETRFSFIRPMKRAGGRRFYRPQDITVLRGVRTLLHDEGYTIKGVQRLHREQGVARLLAAASGEAVAQDAPAMIEPNAAAPSDAPPISDADRDRLAHALAELESAKAQLDHLLRR